MILKRNEYINKVGTALNDPKHNKLLNKNPLSSLKKRVKKLLKSWEEKGVFECDIAFINEHKKYVIKKIINHYQLFIHLPRHIILILKKLKF